VSEALTRSSVAAKANSGLVIAFDKKLEPPTISERRGSASTGVAKSAKCNLEIAINGALSLSRSGRSTGCSFLNALNAYL
jgi:hypothetical protein